MLAAALQSNTSLRTLAIHAHSLDAVSVAADEPADDPTGELVRVRVRARASSP